MASDKLNIPIMKLTPFEKLQKQCGLVVKSRPSVNLNKVLAGLTAAIEACGPKTIKIDVLSNKEFDVSRSGGNVDLHVAWESESKSWLCDMFKADEPDTDKAHIGDAFTVGTNPTAPDWAAVFNELEYQV